MRDIVAEAVLAEAETKAGGFDHSAGVGLQPRPSQQTLWGINKPMLIAISLILALAIVGTVMNFETMLFLLAGVLVILLVGNFTFRNVADWLRYNWMDRPSSLMISER